MDFTRYSTKALQAVLKAQGIATALGARPLKRAVQKQP